jgi:hypothetical protein
MPLGSSFAKIRRADAHLRLLHSEIAGWQASGPYVFETTVYAQGASPTGPLRYYSFDVASVRQPPADIGAILGDFLNDLRGALDHLAWQFAIVALGREPTDEEARSIYFPIAKTFPDFRRLAAIQRGYFGTIRSPPVLLMRRHQPYKRRETPQSHELSVLAALSNRDKHRAVHLAQVFVQESGPDFIATDGAIQAVRFRSGDVLEAGSHVAVVAMTPTGPNPDVHMDVFTIDIAFGERPYVKFGGLRLMHKKVLGIILEGSTLLLKMDATSRVKS